MPSGRKSHSKRHSKGGKSGKKSSRSNKAKKAKQRQHKKNLAAGRKTRHGKTVAQVVLLTLNAYSSNDHGCTFIQLQKCMKSANINVSTFILKKVLHKMFALKVIKHTTKTRYAATGVHLPRSRTFVRKRATKKSNKDNQEFRNLLRRIANKQKRGGKTFAKVIFDYLGSDGHKSETFNQIKAFLNHGDMHINNFILKKVLDRLRENHFVKCVNAHNRLTGKPFRSGRSKKH